MIKRKCFLPFAILGIVGLMFMVGCSTKATIGKKPTAQILVPELAPDIAEIIRFNDALREGKPIMIKFFSPTCSACKQIQPTVEEIRSEWEGKVVFIYFDITGRNHRHLSKGIGYVPTLRFIDRQGKPRKDLVGVRPKEAIKKELQAISSGVE